jgi:hypothetical protein
VNPVLCSKGLTQPLRESWIGRHFSGGWDMRFIFAVLWLVTVPFVGTANAVPVEIIYTGLASGFTNYSPYLCGYDCYFTNVPVLLTYWFNVPGGATSFSNSYVDTVAQPVPGFVYGTPTAGAALNFGGYHSSTCTARLCRPTSIVQSIIEGTAPAHLTVTELAKSSAHSWHRQQHLLKVSRKR